MSGSDRPNEAADFEAPTSIIEVKFFYFFFFWMKLNID